MDIQKKFQKGKKSHSYQRVDANYSVNIFLGYNEDGLMSMVITENGAEVPVKSSKIINVRLKRREDKKIAISFDLLDDTYKPMFLIFCKDIIITCEKVGSNRAISNALIRWKYWKEMFGRKNYTILDKNEIKGLLGELLELKEHFMQKYDETTAISSWVGPLFGHKDFEISNTWYEVKSVNESSTQVIISSFEQLESEEDGHLVVVRLEETGPKVANSINLNTMVAKIVDCIEDPDNLELFRTKLNNVGYLANSEYDSYNFLHKSTQRYVVNENFPRLRRNNVDPSIGNAKYTILLNGIADFMES